MLFITTRQINDKEDSYLFSEQIAPTEEVYYCEKYLKDGFVRYQEIGSIELMSRLKKSDYKQVLLYIHGFNNQPEEAISCGELLQQLYDNKEKNSVIVIPIIWPCNSKVGIIRDYWSDQQSADMSGFALGRAIKKFMEWQINNVEDKTPCLKYINILAHSMGNRVLRSAISKFTKYENGGCTPLMFRNIFMVAADVNNDTFNSIEGKSISYACKNLAIYYAGDDQALRGSKVINASTNGIKRRLGHSGPTENNLPNITSIDCDSVNSKYDILGHTYFIDLKGWYNDNAIKSLGGIVFDHIYDCLKTGKVSKDLNKFNLVKNILRAK